MLHDWVSAHCTRVRRLMAPKIILQCNQELCDSSITVTYVTHFTLSYDRWSRSGQNDAQNFSQFYGSNTIGRESHILFDRLRCAERNETNDLLDFYITYNPSDCNGGQWLVGFISSTIYGQRKAQKRNVKDALGDSIGKLQKAFRVHRSSQEEVKSTPRVQSC